MQKKMKNMYENKVKSQKIGRVHIKNSQKK